MENIKIPVGRWGFADIRMNNYYFADKSGLIEELLRFDKVCTDSLFSDSYSNRNSKMCFSNTARTQKDNIFLIF